MKYIYNPIYDLPEFESEIQKEMPKDFAKESGNFLYSSTPEGMQIYLLCNHPILSKQQEQFLFKKYNFLKHKFNQTNNELTKKEIRHKICEVRDDILGYNYRSIIFFLKKRDNDVFSNLTLATFIAMQSIDCFDWSKQFRFSTYLLNSLGKSFGRETYKERNKLLKNGELIQLRSDKIDVVEKEQKKYPKFNIDYVIDSIQTDNPIAKKIAKIKFIEGDNNFDRIGKRFNLNKHQTKKIYNGFLKQLEKYLFKFYRKEYVEFRSEY